MHPNAQFDFCLLIPCYNNFPGLIHSIRSVVYDPAKYCVLVVDDGSKESVDENSVRNELNEKINLVVLRNEYNLGITYTLNRGLAYILNHFDTLFIARLDCGDICHSERFVKQVEWMHDNPSTMLLGSWCYFQERDTLERYTYRTPLLHDEIKKEMYYRNVFIHPTVMFRTGIVTEIGLYPGNFPYAEDYAFFWRIIERYPSAIIGECLVTCEINKSGISYQNKSKQLMARWRVVNAFGANLALKFLACARLILLFIIPGQLSLRFKKWRS
jgi:GT2 family glycosyltransferase